MPLHSFIANALATNPAPLITQVPLEEWRAALQTRFTRTRPIPFRGRITDLSAYPSNVPVRVYEPLMPAPPVMIFAHGGGFVFGDLETFDGLCRHLATLSGCVVVSVGYRLAPEHPFPAGLDDYEDVVQWVLAGGLGKPVHIHELALVGESAGGAIAAGAALRLRDTGPRAGALGLLYPVLDHWSSGWPSYEKWATGVGLTREAMTRYWDLYMDGASPDTPGAAPLRAESLGGLPPTALVVAEYDILHDEATAFAERARAAGGRVSVSRGLGLNHGFAALADILPEAHAMVSAFARSLRNALDEARA